MKFVHERTYDKVAYYMTDSQIGAKRNKKCEKSFTCAKLNN